MKRQLSLLMLASRSQIYRAVGILTAMAVVQLGLGLWHMGDLNEITGYCLELVLDWAWFRWAAALSMAALFASCGALGRRGGRVDYTWYRLPVSHAARTVWPLVFGVLLFLIVWAVQLAVALIVATLFCQRLPEWSHQQTTFLAAYRSGYFHTLLPLEDGWRWVATIFRYVGLGLYSGIAMLRSYRGKRTIFPFVAIIAMTLVVGSLGSYEWDVIVVGVLWFMICMSVFYLPGREEEDNGEEETP